MDSRFELEKFLNSTSDFALICGDKGTRNQSKVLVLDSSFNPPHLGHLELIISAREHFQNYKVPVLLLLSVNNVDKQAKPAEYWRRLDMMVLMADHLNKQGIETLVAITKHAKFVDKAITLENALCEEAVFLVGFDTLIRIFDPKYYPSSTVAEALAYFMTKSQLFCLTRVFAAKEDIKQSQYLSRISKGELEPDIPSAWAQRITLLINEYQTAHISSSEVRAYVIEGQDISAFVLPSILSYINDTNAIFNN